MTPFLYQQRFTHLEVIPKEPVFLEVSLQQNLKDLPLGVSPILALDEDSPFHQALSPRFHPNTSLEMRLSPILEYIKTLKTQFPYLGIACLIEELCPGGLDLTDGLYLFEQLTPVADFFIASCGTKDFPSLKYRKPTHEKPERGLSFEQFPCPSLGSLQYALKATHKPVWAQIASYGNLQASLKRAQALGFCGAVKNILNH